jgi:RimJ/RimL family protein N-acetyltransferase
MVGAGTYEWGEHLPTLRAQRVVLRELTEHDVKALFEIFSDPAVMRYWSSPPMGGPAEAQALLHNIHEGFWDRRLFQWGIALVAEDRLVGTCTLFHVDRAHRRAEIGFALDRAHQGKGLAAEAVGRLIAFAFGELDLHRLEADADPRNARSLKLLERLGFRREGYLRERYLVGGEVQDAVFLGLLRGEWSRSDAGA